MKGSYRTADGKAQINWELKDKNGRQVFSATGDCSGSHGQCLGKIAEKYPDDELVQDIVSVWKDWHLNDMNAGCGHLIPENIDIIEVRYKGTLIRDPFKDIKIYQNANNPTLFKDILKAAKRGEVFIPQTDADKSWLEPPNAPIKITTVTKNTGWVREQEHSKGLFGKKCPVCGVVYGAAWYYRPIPQDIINRILTWPKSELEDLSEYQAKRFLEKSQIQLRFNLSNTKKPKWEVFGNHYIISLARNNCTPVSFDFWDSFSNKEQNLPPSYSSILHTIQITLDCPDTFEEFCNAYGENNDSIKSLNCFKSSIDLKKKLQTIFSPEDEEKLLALNF